MTATVRPTLDPMYRHLPTDDGTPRYVPIEVPRGEIADLTLRTLRRPAWHRHRVGGAVYAHCVNGSRWIIGLSVGEDIPAWWDRLGAKRGR
jgi:hypothetical protein